SEAQTSAAACSTDIGLSPLRLLPLGESGVLNHSPHSLQILLADIGLGENLSDDFAGIAAKEIANDTGDRFAAQVHLTDARAIDEGDPGAPVVDDSVVRPSAERS